MGKPLILLLILLGVLCVPSLAAAQEPGPAEPGEQPAPKPAPQPAQEEQRLDIIFVIDASGSVEWTDPGDFRKAVANALVDITQNRGGDRIAVVQFAGWNETSDKGSTVFNLTTIPKDARVREFLLNEIKTAVNTKLGSFGTATDFNFAFEKALKEVMNQRAKAKSENKIWLVLISDGSMEVVEAKGVRPAYRAKLTAEGKSINRANVNEAAAEMFTEEVLPKIAADKNTFVTCVNLGAGEPSDVLLKIGELPNAHLLRTSEENLKSVIITAFSTIPEDYGTYGIPRGFAYLRSEVAPASSFSSPVHIYQGAVTTHLLVLGATRDFSIDIRNREDASILDKSSVVVLGGGESYRLVSITNEQYGEYSLQVTNNTGAPAGFEFLEYMDLDLTPHVSVSGMKSEFLPGESLKFEAGLKDPKTAAFVEDPVLISQAEVLLQVKDVEGKITESAVTFTDQTRAVTNAQFKLPDDAPGGEYELLVRVGVLKKTVSERYAYLSEPVVISFSVLSPVVELQFAQKEGFVGQAVEIVGDVVKGSLTEKQKQEGIKARITHKDSQAEKEAALAFDNEQERLTGTVVLDKTNEWNLQESPLGTGRLKPGESRQIQIRPRQLRTWLVDDQGGKSPLDVLELEGRLGEATVAKLIVEADMAAKERGEIAVAFSKAMEAADVSITISGGTEAATAQMKGENPSVPLALALKLDRYPDGTDVGELVVKVELPGSSLEKKILVKTKIPPKPFPWLYAAIAGGAALLILILLLLLLGGPSFDQQQLHIVGGGAGHHIKKWKVGKKNAVGTVEVPGTLQFRLKGGKASPKCMTMPGKNSRVFINNIECTYWTEVHHGDYVEIYPAGDEYSYRYRYFERTPTAGELQMAGGVTEEIGEGVFLGEDEFILADDDDLGAAPSDATQALLEQARRMKERMEVEGTEILAVSSERREESTEEADLLRAAAQTTTEDDFTEAVPPLPEEHTEAMAADSFFEAEEIEATQVIGADEEGFFEEAGAPEEGADFGEEFDLPVSEDVDSEPTQAIGEEVVFEEMEGEPTQAIIAESGAEEEMHGEPTEEMGTDSPLEELAQMGDERLEMSEFIEEGEPGKAGEGDDGLSLADELDRTFDQILGEEEKEKEI